MRPASSTCIALMKPWPSSPSSGSAGTRQSSKMTSLVSLARMPSLFSFCPARMPGRACRDDERGDAAVAPRPIGDRHRHHHAGDAAVGDERLGAVDDPAVRRRGARPCACRPRRCPPSARSAPRRPASRRSPAARGSAAAAPSVPNMCRCAAQSPLCAATLQRDRRIDAREFLDADAVVDRRHARPAEALGELDAQQPELGQLRQQVRRESAAPRPTPSRADRSRSPRTRGRCRATAAGRRSGGDP